MQDRPKALYEKYDMIPETGMSFPEVPKHIKDNIAYPLRPYQEEAIGRWLQYMDNDTKNKVLPVQLLFNMATGSGKTLIMAALILDLYKRGFRNFIYFVNSTNIIEKTRDNFSNPASSKYLFANNIMIDGKRVEIKDVENFSDGDSDAINIVFTTIQGLHTDLNIPRENRLSYTDFENMKVVLIGDEAHHNNSKTLLDKDDLEDNRSWEATVDNITNTAKESLLLEFTATIDLDDASIYRKYCDRIIYRYDLRHFRSDGFSKDVLIYHVDSDIETRMLQAIIISQYRKKVALRNNIWLKPVVMFKSKTIAENKKNFESFNSIIKNLSTDVIAAQRKDAESILAEAFAGIELSDNDLVEELKNDFMPERLMLIDGNNISGDKQLKLNSLEDENNELRAIFAVDMLNEGWDVLNLFDIVRLYDTRDAKDNKPGKTTIREAQLIGRGARYYPFVTDDPEKKYVRKFDNNENEELRLLEQLHYHSANNPKYVQEIRQALISSGIMEENYVERTLKLKEGFKKTRAYQEGVVFTNERETVTAHNRRLGESSGSAILGWDFKSQPMTVEISLPTGLAGVTNVFGDSDNEASTPATENFESTLGKVVPSNIMRHALAKNKTFRFNNIREKMFGIKSQGAFIENVGNIRVSVNGIGIGKGDFTPAQKLFIAEEILTKIEEQFEINDEQYVGTEEFTPKKISEIFPADIKRKFFMKDTDSDQEFGVPQSYPKNEKYALNLNEKEWYAYNENYGTSEEKSLVKAFDGLFSELCEKWDDIYLIRNEKAFAIYNFMDGKTFEPDYLLIANDKKTGNISYQIFIEPKGQQLLEADKWKEDFLREIMNRNIAEVLADNSKVRIVGLPFYNEEFKREEFIDALKDLGK